LPYSRILIIFSLYKPPAISLLKSLYKVYS
jgi:hypothetical protein